MVLRVAAVLLAVLLVTGVSAVTVAAPNAQKVTLTLTDFAFTPGKVTVRSGVPVELTMVNKGKVEHEFMLYPMGAMGSGTAMDMHAFAEKNTYFKEVHATVVFLAAGEVETMGGLVEVVVKPAQTVTLRFTPRKKGTFEFGCHIEGHYEAGMKGTLTIK